MAFRPVILLALAAALAAPAAAPAAAPLKGLVLWPDEARANPALSREIALEFAYGRPSDLVTAFDGRAPTCDWAPLDRLLDDIASRGHQAILRVRYEYPGEPLDGVSGATAVPDCIKALPGYRETFARNPNGDGPTFYADWSHPALRAFTLAFFAALAERYDADPRLAFLEVGFGHWSEWHVCGTRLRPGVNFPSADFQKQFLRLVANRFRQTPWLISIDAADRGNSPLAASPDLLALPFGLFDDSFMHRDHEIGSADGYNERCWRALGPDRWQRAPAGGEISYFEDSDQRNFLSPGGLHGVTFEAAAAKYHVTFMIANDAPSGPFATPERFRAASDATGYRLRLDATSTNAATLLVRIANDGVAPLYHDAYPALGPAVSPDTLRGLLPGETRTCRIPLPPAAPPVSPSAVRITSPKLLPGATLPLSRP